MIVFITPLHRWNEDGGLGTWKPDGVAQHPLKDYAKAVRDVCEQFAIPVLDVFGKGGMPINVHEYAAQYTTDALHPNDEGHKILASKLGKFLENL